MKYLIDANTFITPHRGYAPIDVAVTLWNKFKGMSDNNTILLLDRVQQELYVHADALQQWVNENFNVASLVTFQNNQHAVTNYGVISRWAAAQNRSQKALNKFLRIDSADIFLVAYAATDPEMYTVVSFESSNNNASFEFKLPDVCNQFGVRCIPFQDMFRELNETY
jgi:hypothetical protein